MTTESIDPVAPGRTMYPMSEFRDRGLLWLFNRVVMHPRGFALAFYYPTDEFGEEIPNSDPMAWTILGNGTELWSMGDLPEDERFEAVEALLMTAEGENGP